MTDQSPSLPPPAEIGELLWRRREQIGVSQTDIASRIGVSPSQISRIENRTGRATYDIVYQLQQELTSMDTKADDQTVTDVLQTKQQAVGDTYDLLTADVDETVAVATERMVGNDVSQLPVLDTEGQAVGRLTEQDLLAVDDPQATIVETVMQPPFPEVPASIAVSVINDLLVDHPAVLVTEEWGSTGESTSDSEYAGILTRTDLVRFDTE